MVKFTVLINDVDAVQRLNKIAQMCEGDVDVTSGHYVVDAKSIMGLFSLNLSKPVIIMLHLDKDEEMFANALEVGEFEHQKGE